MCSMSSVVQCGGLSCILVFVSCNSAICLGQVSERRVIVTQLDTFLVEERRYKTISKMPHKNLEVQHILIKKILLTW